MRRLLQLAWVLSLVVLAGGSPALGASTRAEYAAQVNQICASANEQHRQLAEQLREIKRKKGIRSLTKLDVRFDRRSLVVDAEELAQLRQVPPAPGDEAIVSSWLAARQGVHESGQRRLKLGRELIQQSRHIRTRKDDERFDRLQEKDERLGNRSIPFLQADKSLGTELGASECVARYQPVPLPGGGDGSPI